MKKLLLVLLALPLIGFGQCTSGNCFNGYGVFTSSEGTYKGNWKNGKVHGTGVFVGILYTYDGEYVNGQQHGQGKKTFTNGKIEEGTFENGILVKRVELTAKDYFNKAYDYAENEQYQLAIDNYTSAIRIDPDDAYAYYNRGYAYDELKNYTAAIADYTSALRINPDDAYAYNNRGYAYKKLENYTAAIADYTSALRINPDFSEAYNNRGNAYKKLKNYTAAIADYTSALRIDPDLAEAYMNRGITKENAGQSYCSDYKKCCDLGDNECCEWYYKQCK